LGNNVGGRRNVEEVEVVAQETRENVKKESGIEM
jgi:hypothetical protein